MNATSCKVTVLRQSTVAADIRCLTVQWPDASHPAKAGQFFMLRAWAANETPILSRPISVHDFDAATGALTFLYQVKGEGTQLSLIHISEPTRPDSTSRMPSSA